MRRSIRLGRVAAVAAAATVLFAGAASAMGAGPGPRPAVLTSAAPKFTVTTAATKVAVTNDRRPVAGGVYDAAVNTTFISWSGANMDNYVQSYNGKWSAPVLVGAGDGDPHNYPTMVEANNGHLLVFRGLHNTQLDIATSPQAHSISGRWTETTITVGPAATYPMPVKADNGDIYVFYRQTDEAVIPGAPVDERPMEYVESTDDGATWTSSKTITGAPYVIGSTTRTDHMNEIYVGQIRHEENPERFTFVWTLAGGGPTQHVHDAFHKDLYFATFTPSDHHFHNAAGQDLGTSVQNGALASCLVVHTGAPVDKNPGYFQFAGTFADGTPTVVYSMSDGDYAGHWTGKAWQTSKIGTGYVLDMEPAGPSAFRVYTASGSTVTTYLLGEKPSWTRETSFTAPGSVNHGVVITGYHDPLRLLLEGPTGGGIYVAGVPTGKSKAGVAGDVYVSPTGDDTNPGTASAPVKTVQRAQTIVRGLDSNMSSDITVVLEDGFYRMTSPLTLDAADSGTNGHNVIWTADTGARPVLAGSDQITGWAPMSAGSPIWVAQAPSGLQTRQLYVNGIRAARANGPLPAALTGQDSTGYSGGGSTMAGWKNPSGASPQLEFVYQGGLGAWTEPRCPVASFSGAAVTMAQPCWNNSTNRAGSFPDGRAYNLVGRSGITEQPTSVENAFQFLGASTPGQWFLDQGDSKLYYVPRPGETMSSADVEAPVLQSLVTGNGTATAPVHNIVFNGIQFSYATWLGPSFQGQGSSNGFSEIQADYQVTGANGAASQGLCHVPPPTYTLGICPFGAWTQIPGNVSFTYDQHIQFTGDAFVHLGAAGLALGDGSQNDVVKADIVTDTSGNGIELGNVDMPTATGSSQTSGNTVTDNHVFNLPAEFHGGIGIDSGYTANDTVSHNQIDHTPYSAVSQGWGGWPDKEKEAPQPNFSQGNAIANNLIFDHMQLLNDGGAIYTQGITGTSLTNGEHVTGNLIHDQTGSGHVIYTDNGCTFETITGNAVYNNTSAQAWASEHTDYAPGATTTHDPTDVENNYFQNPAGYTTGGGVTVANNTTITSGSQVPSSIVANAGLEAAYQGLLSWTQAPLPPVGGGGGGVVLSNLVVGDTANAASWSLQTNLEVGDPIVGDRSYTVATLPAALVGDAWVRAADNSKNSTANPLVTFTISQAATVYVGVDQRSGKRPWMDASWVDTGTVLTTSENGTPRPYEVYSKGFGAGQVALGPNAANTTMYTITAH